MTCMRVDCENAATTKIIIGLRGGLFSQIQPVYCDSHAPDAYEVVDARVRREQAQKTRWGR